MSNLIDKDTLVTEIERLIKYDEMVMDHNTQITELLSRELNTLYELSSFIKSLEVKEMDLKLNSFDANSILERIDNEIDRLLFNNCREIDYKDVIQMIRHEIRTIRNEIKAQKGE